MRSGARTTDWRQRTAIAVLTALLSPLATIAVDKPLTVLIVLLKDAKQVVSCFIVYD